MKSKESLSNTQKQICIIIDGIATILFGIFLLFVGLGLTVYEFRLIILFAALLFIGLAMTVNSFVQTNSLLLWLGIFLCVSSSVGFLAEGISALSYANLYPIFIAAPAAASLITLCMSKEIRLHLFISLFFGILSILFSMEAGNIISINIILPIAVILIGIIIIGAIFPKGDKNGK